MLNYVDHSCFSLGRKLELVAELHGEQPAIVFGHSELRFTAFNALSNQLARYLKARSIGRGDVVFIELPKRPATYALIFACLKLGAAYVLADSKGPEQRSRAMISRCGPKLVVSIRESHEDALVLTESDLDDRLTDLVGPYSQENLEETQAVTAHDIAYIMFTSGSTGEPKGAAIHHLGVMNLVEWARAGLEIGPDDRLSNVNPIYFDNSVFDIFCGLLNGAAIIPVDVQEISTPARIPSMLSEAGCTFVFSVPTLFIVLQAMRVMRADKLPTVRKIMFGGEAFPIAQLLPLFHEFKDQARLINCYGPTECSCICSALEVTQTWLDQAEGGILPLGPINPNFYFYILDDNEEVVGSNEVGELWLGGPNVGFGYYNNSELTQEHFRADPLCAGVDRLMYRTGDLVSWDERLSVLRFHGRKDNQVKIRGFRD